MANIASSKKDARRSAVRAVRNRGLKSSVKTKVTKVRRAVADGEEGVAELGLIAISALDRAAAKGIIHRNNAARRKSRVMKRLATAGTEAAAPAKGTKAAPKKAAAKRPAAKRPAPKPAAKVSAAKSAPAKKAAAAKPAAAKKK
jgi:small subunit ribosomal protein S20